MKQDEICISFKDNKEIDTQVENIWKNYKYFRKTINLEKLK